MDIDGDTSGSVGPSSSLSNGDFSDLVGSSLPGNGSGGENLHSVAGTEGNDASSSDANAAVNVSSNTDGETSSSHLTPDAGATEPDFSHLVNLGPTDSDSLPSAGLSNIGADVSVLGHHDMGGDVPVGDGTYDSNVAHALDTVLHDAGSALDMLTTSHDLFDVPVLDLGDTLPT